MSRPTSEGAPWEAAFDDAFVAAARLREDAGEVRAERAARIARAHDSGQFAGPARAWAPPAASPADPRWAPPPSPAGRRWPVIALAGVILLVAVALAPHVPLRGGPFGAHALTAGRVAPPPSSEEAARPLGHPAPVAVRSLSYSFLNHQFGSSAPVTYDPCRPIHYVVNPAREPIGAAGSIQQSIAAVSAATGLRFIDDGSTTETYSQDRADFQPERYGERWAPVLIDFTAPGPGTVFTDGAVGLGGSSMVQSEDQHLTYVTGAIDLDTVAAAQALGNRGGVPLSAIIEHELGHVVGLAHVPNITDLMYPSAGHGISTYGAGDLTGLAQLGVGRCEPGI